MERNSNQTILVRPKWLTYAKILIDGKPNNQTLAFSLPNTCYNNLLAVIKQHRPVEECKCYDEIVDFARLAIGSRFLKDAEDPFPFRCGQSGAHYDNLCDEDYGEVLMNYNEGRELVNTELRYLRIFDPYAEGKLQENCIKMLKGDERYAGKQVSFSWTDSKEAEEYHWSVEYYDEEFNYYSEVEMFTHLVDAAPTIYRKGSIIPPYQMLMSELNHCAIRIESKDLSFEC